MSASHALDIAMLPALAATLFAVVGAAVLVWQWVRGCERREDSRRAVAEPRHRHVRVVR